MSRTDLDATTLANSLRMRAGDGSIEWIHEPMQASVLLDIADILDENAKLRELLSSYWKRTHSPVSPNVERDYLLEMRELGIDVEG